MKYFSSIFFVFGIALGQFTLEMEVFPKRVHVGDSVFLSIQSNISQEYVAKYPDFVEDSDTLLFLDKQLDENNAIYIFAAFELGTIIIPPIEVRILQEGEEISKLLTATDSIFVESVLAGSTEQNQNIRSMKGMREISLRNYKNVIIASAVLLLAIIIASILWRRREIQVKKAKKWQKPKDPPHIAALKALESQGLPTPINKRTVEAYYLALSNIFKEFIADELFVKAREMTSTELHTFLESQRIPADDLSLIYELMNRSDLSKYAAQIPSSEDLSLDRARMSEFVKSIHAQFRPLSR